MASPAMIRAQHLAKRFDDFWAVRDFTLEVRGGEVVAVLGPNGAGKTTSVRMLVSLLRPTRGKAWVAGFNTVEQSKEVRGRVGVLTEQHGLYLRMPAQEYLDFFARIYGVDEREREERIARWLRYFGLWEFRHQRIASFSKGMRQKLALARALIHEPPVILLDEPTSAMDPESALLVRKAIAGLRSARRAILLCTHNLAEAESLANRIAIIRRGEIVTVGTPQELKEKWLGLPIYEIAVDRVLRGLPPLPAAVEVLHSAGNIIRFRSPDWRRYNPIVVQALVHRGLGVVYLRQVPRSLEEVYIKVMQYG